jgi:hypothetical protein
LCVIPSNNRWYQIIWKPVPGMFPHFFYIYISMLLQYGANWWTSVFGLLKCLIKMRFKYKLSINYSKFLHSSQKIKSNGGCHLENFRSVLVTFFTLPVNFQVEMWHQNKLACDFLQLIWQVYFILSSFHMK